MNQVVTTPVCRPVSAARQAIVSARRPVAPQAKAATTKNAGLLNRFATALLRSLAAVAV